MTAAHMTAFCDWVAKRRASLAQLRRTAAHLRERVVTSGYRAPDGIHVDDTRECADRYEQAASRLDVALAAVDRRYAEISPVS